MAGYKSYKKKRGVMRRLLILVIVFVVLITSGIFLAWRAYNQGLKPVSGDQRTQVVEIKTGSSTAQIGKLLADKHLIRSSWAFDL